MLSVKDASGNTITDTTSIALINPIRYRGYVYDSDSGLYYLQSRYYDPTTCRFVNADCYSDTCTGVISTNMFAYC
ncbi:MAG: RHS repeat-associated core domain-containing protein, partial [Bacillota bacterium]|nr:RHS repeat-associated core domain-containing protein [Bacillota bacterium]